MQSALRRGMLENVLFNGLIPPLRPVLPTPNPTWFRPARLRTRDAWLGGLQAVLLLSIVLVSCGGCSAWRPKPAREYVYVTAKETFLRDRVAAVSNRTGTVENGEKLQVLEHGRRFLKVQTPKGEQGWIDEKVVATQEVFDQFKALAREHKKDPAVATAVVRDEVNLHLKPGRETERFYRLLEGDKVQLLERATLPKPIPPGAMPARTPANGPDNGPDKDAPLPPIAMEDWWLGRDGAGRTGWLLSRMIDVDAPDSVTRYAEGQRIVGAYVLTTVHDEGAEGDNKDIPIYLTVMGPYLAGLPYDFDQVRVFTWNLKMHRYETAFREKNIEGFLPVKIDLAKDPYGKAAVAETPLPTFTYKVLAADAPTPVPDPVTGLIAPGRTIEKTYRLEGNLVRRVAPPGYKDEPEAHPAPEEKKEKVARKKR